MNILLPKKNDNRKTKDDEFDENRDKDEDEYL